MLAASKIISLFNTVGFVKSSNVYKSSNNLGFGADIHWTPSSNCSYRNFLYANVSKYLDLIADGQSIIRLSRGNNKSLGQ